MAKELRSNEAESRFGSKNMFWIKFNDKVFGICRYFAVKGIGNKNCLESTRKV
jgi:hypothetical protein